jgi:hypothetical protein
MTEFEFEGLPIRVQPAKAYEQTDLIGLANTTVLHSVDMP